MTADELTQHIEHEAEVTADGICEYFKTHKDAEPPMPLLAMKQYMIQEFGGLFRANHAAADALHGAIRFILMNADHFCEDAEAAIDMLVAMQGAIQRLEKARY